MKALWNEIVLAESDTTVVVEGNHYFPPASVRMEHLQKSGETYTCAWKGIADYYDVHAGGKVNPGAAWSYPHPTQAASEIAVYYAFWKGVEILK